MRVYCRLRELMKDRRMKLADLARLTGIDDGRLRNLDNDTWKSIKRAQIGRLLDVFDTTIDRLFVAYDDDIWTPIRVHREVTIHFGSNSSLEAPDDRSIRRGDALRESIGYWDLRAFSAIGEYISRTGDVAALKFKTHPTNAMEPDALEEVLRDGNHLIIGSPIANSIAEGVVSDAFGVSPTASDVHDRFPYNFVWDAGVQRVSSFGLTTAHENEMGVMATRSRQLVARRTLVNHASVEDGQDCALIVTHLLSGGRKARGGAPAGGEDEVAEDGSRILIVIMGHSGPGTLAGAQAIIDPRNRGGFHPVYPARTRMRVVSARYRRQAPGERDSRVLTHRQLEPEEPTGDSA